MSSSGDRDLAHVLRARIRQQQVAAKRLCDELLALPAEEQVAKIRRSIHRLRSRPVAEELIARSRRAIQCDAAESVRLGRLAREVCLTLVGALELAGGMRGINDVQALAFATIANGHRVACDFEAAEGCFRRAHFFLERGTGDPVALAEVLSLEGTFWQNLRQHETAWEVLSSADRLFEEFGSPAEIGRSRLKKASVLIEAGNLAEALSVQMEACDILDHAGSPALAVVAWKNLAMIHVKLGNPEAALMVLEDTDEEAEEVLEPTSSLHLYRSWVRAKAWLELGRLEDAERALRTLQEEFAARNIPYDVALIGLDLARVHLLQGRHGEVAEGAEALLVALERVELHEEAHRAVLFLAAAARDTKVH